ncbi:hypothetical protein J6590_008173, partial [Homalodisca vitripennis]
ATDYTKKANLCDRRKKDTEPRLNKKPKSPASGGNDRGSWRCGIFANMNKTHRKSTLATEIAREHLLYRRLAIRPNEFIYAEEDKEKSKKKTLQPKSANVVLYKTCKWANPSLAATAPSASVHVNYRACQSAEAADDNAVISVECLARNNLHYQRYQPCDSGVSATSTLGGESDCHVAENT